MNVAGGLSQAFIEGGKDLIALVKYLGDKEMQEKKYGLDKQRVENTQQYQQGLLQHMSKQDELANKNYRLNELRAETQSDLAEQRYEDRAMNAGWKQMQAEEDVKTKQTNRELLQAKIDYYKSLAEKAKNTQTTTKQSKPAYKLSDIKAGFNMAMTKLKNFVNTYARTLNISNDMVGKMDEYFNSDNPEQVGALVNALKQSKYEALPKDKQELFSKLIADTELWYDKYKNVIFNSNNGNTQTTVKSQWPTLMDKKQGE